MLDVIGDQLTWFDQLLNPRFKQDDLYSIVIQGTHGFSREDIRQGYAGTYEGTELVSLKIIPFENQSQTLEYPMPDIFAAECVAKIVASAIALERPDLALMVFKWMKDREQFLESKIIAPTNENKTGYQHALDRLKMIARRANHNLPNLKTLFSEHELHPADRAELLSFMADHVATSDIDDIAKLYDLTFLSFKDLRQTTLEDRGELIKVRQKLGKIMTRIESLKLNWVNVAGISRSFTETLTYQIGSAFNGTEKAKRSETRKLKNEQVPKLKNELISSDGELPANLDNQNTPKQSLKDLLGE